MGAVPKNKITSVERGKRRAGNTKSVIKQLAHTSTPLHKQSLVAAMFKKLGLTNQTKTQ